MSSFYERRLLNAESLEVRRILSDPLAGIVMPEDVTLELSNVDKFFNGQDLRGTVVDLTRFDKEDAESALEFSGKIVEQTLKDDRIILRLTSLGQDALQTLIPRRTVTSSLFPLADPNQGLGKAIPVVFGNAVGPYPLPYVTDNTSSNIYDYLLGEGTSYSTVTLYRDTVGSTLAPIVAADYTLNSSAFAGLTVARFPLRQAKFGGGLHQIYAATNGMSAERNFAQAVWTVLTNSVWGLNLTNINSSSFSQGVAALNTVGSLACDGVLYKQAPAIDVINQLLLPRGMTLSNVQSGMWSLTVDQSSATTVYVATFGHGDGQIWRNVTQFNGLTRTPVQNAISTLYVDYSPNFLNDRPQSTVSRPILSSGRERRLRNDFLVAGAAADKTVDYLSKRLIQADQQISFTAGQEARNVQVGDKIKYTAPQLGMTNQVFKVTGTVRKIGTTQIAAEGWATSIYDYAAGTVPSDVVPATDSLWSVTTPTAASSLIIVGSGTTADGQGGFGAFQTLRYTVTSESFAQTIVRQQTSGNSQWVTVAVDQAMGANLSTRVDGLITGQVYNFQVSRVNQLNPYLHADVSLSNITAPTDAAAPAAPTSLVITDQHLKSIAFAWTAPADKDVAYYHWEIRTAASGGGSLVAEGNTEGGGTKVALTLNQIAYTTTRYLRVYAADWSGNLGAYSGSLSFSFSQVITGDVTNNAISGNGFYSNDSSSVIGTTETEIGTITITTDGGYVFVTGKCDALPIVSQRSGVTIRKDTTSGTTLDFGELELTVSGGTSILAPITVIGIDSSPATSQTYKLTAKVHIGSGTIPFTYRRLTAVNIKK